MTIPNWLSSKMSSDDAIAIENAVKAAELKSSGEIVPMIVRRSVSVRSAPYIALMAMLSLLFIVGVWFHFNFANHMHLAWLAVGVTVSILVSAATLFVQPLQRFFTPHGDEVDASFQRAQLEFFQTGIPMTEGRTGVLIFVSLFERRAFVLGDEAISQKMSNEAWVEITHALVQKLKHGEYKEGFVGAIEAVGQKLAMEFPRAKDDRDELSNQLVIKD